MDKLYPIEAERVILGSLLLSEGSDLQFIDTMLVSSSFSAPNHSNLYDWIKDSCARGEPISIHVLVEKEGTTKCNQKYGTIEYLESLGDKAVLPERLPRYAKVVSDMSKLRSLLASVESIKNKILTEDDSVERIKAYAEAVVLDNDNGISVGCVESATEVVDAAKDSFDKMLSGEEYGEFIPTGMPAFDAHFMGWPRGLPTYIGGRSKMGKTAFMLASVAKAAVMGIPQGIVSIEMGKKQLAYRLASYFSGVSLREALDKNSGNSAYKDLFRWGLDEVARLPIHIDDSSRNVDIVSSTVRQMKRVHGCETVWIDYVQLVSGHGKAGDDRSRLDAVADSIRQVAKEERVAVVALAQFNRQLDQRIVDGVKGLPISSDFRGSDKFLHDAGLAFGVYRPFYYDPPMRGKDKYTDDELSPLFQPLQLVCLAAREASRKTVELVYQTSWGRIYDTSEPQPDWWTGTWPPSWT
tara:strand:- start:19304 stop:20704 length:1401 start_codon:yes stop_codon:yes gene_type:complete